MNNYDDIDPQTRSLLYALDQLFGPSADQRQLDKAKSNVIQFKPMDPEVSKLLHEQ